MALFSPKPEKIKQVELQNIIFNTNEKKLMVSNDFLENMKKVYISKRMKSINQMVDSLFTTKSPRTFFNNYDSIMTNLDELIVLENYHTFKKPAPKTFKKTLEEKKDKYALAMINRAWKNANSKANFDPMLGQKRDVKKFGPILEEMIEFRDQYTSATFGHIDRFYTSVYGHGIDEAPVVDEEAAEAAAEAAEAAESEVQEFIPEDFGDDMEEMKLNE